MTSRSDWSHRHTALVLTMLRTGRNGCKVEDLSRACHVSSQEIRCTCRELVAAGLAWHMSSAVAYHEPWRAPNLPEDARVLRAVRAQPKTPAELCAALGPIGYEIGGGKGHRHKIYQALTRLRGEDRIAPANRIWLRVDGETRVRRPA